MTHAGCGELAVDTFDGYVSAARRLFEDESYQTRCSWEGL